MKDNAYAALVSANTNIEAGWLYIPAGFRLRLVRPSPLATSGDQPGSVVVAPRRRFDVGPGHSRGPGYGQFQGGS